MVVCGIDPGLTGACCVLTVVEGRVQSCGIHRMPVTHTTINKHNRRSYDVTAMDRFCRELPEVIALVLLERQWARPGEGVASACSTCYGYGLWRGLLTAHGLPHRECTAIAWRKKLGIPAALTGAQRKRAVRDLCMQRIPGAGHIALPLTDAVGIALAAAL